MDRFNFNKYNYKILILAQEKRTAMGKILLVGNGFTSQLIPEYQNDVMMQRIQAEVPDLYERANHLFAPFRKKVDSVQRTAIAWGYSGAFFSGGSPLYHPISDRPYNGELLTHIETELKKYRFDVQPISTDFFQTYGLIYETQHGNISNVESLLKVISLFAYLGEFTREDADHVKAVANQIYYNNGKCGRSAISDVISTRVQRWLSSYQMIFTTNYDVLMDEVLQTNEIRHLHGGFLYNKSDRLKRSKSLVSAEDACLIWGINGEEKMAQIKAGGGVGFPVEFPLESPLSIFESYLQELQTVQAERIDVFGYSGENDQHINSAISQNSNIKQVRYFCDPKKVLDSVQDFDVTLRFGITPPQQIELESWDTIWNLICR